MDCALLEAQFRALLDKANAQATNSDDKLSNNSDGNDDNPSAKSTRETSLDPKEGSREDRSLVDDG